ncbi:MAG TPA: iron-sulfur cluster loop [bacterium]|nr:iron-sulfur cluster loop [bacterium]
MAGDKEKITEFFVEKGWGMMRRPKSVIRFTSDPDARALVNDIENYPHAFTLACIMDRQMPAEKVWAIPHRISKITGGFEFERMKTISKDGWEDIFVTHKLHRYKKIMAGFFYFAVRDIDEKYQGDASKIWNDNPPSVILVNRFRAFKGAGEKIATMAANILCREFKVKVKDYLAIDVSADVHVVRVFNRLGLISSGGVDETIKAARELYPEYPGIFDLYAWKLGRDICRPTNPECAACELKSLCKQDN